MIGIACCGPISSALGWLDGVGFVPHTPTEDEIKHHFLPGLYLKETRIMAGHHLVQHRHEYAHASALARGSVMVSTDGVVWTRHDAPATLLLPAGVAHEVRALCDVVWYCIHPTDETDPEKVDKVLIQGGGDAHA